MFYQNVLEPTSSADQWDAALAGRRVRLVYGFGFIVG
jgi:hypothetical protein